MKSLYKLLLFFCFLFFASYFYLFNLGFENINEDQYRWYYRSENFFKAVANKDWSGTYQQYHPGISLIYFIKFGYETFKFQNSINFTDFKTIPYNLFPSFNFATKIYLVLFCLLLITICAFLLAKNLSFQTALFFILILGFDTYFIGITRNLHLDSLVSLLSFASILSLYTFLNTKNSKYLILTIFLNGLGLLSKSVFILALGVQFLIYLYFLFKSKTLGFYLKSFLIVNLASILLFIALFPSMWVNPFGTLQRIFIDGAINTGLEGEDSFMHYVNGLELTNPGFKFYPWVFYYRFSPLLIFLLFFTIIGLVVVGVKKIKFKEKTHPLIFFTLIFLFTYLLIIFYSPKKTDRYISLIYPPMSFVLAYYYQRICELFKNRYVYAVALPFLILTLTFNFLIHPYYFAFYNPLFGGQKEAKNNIYINQGGLAYLEIIKYIDSLNLQEPLKVGAINNEELVYSSRIHIGGLRYYDYFKKNYQILPLQRGDSYIKNSTQVQSINIMGQEYWRIYKLNEK